MRVDVSTTVGSYRFEIRNSEDILDLIVELLKLRHEDNEYQWVKDE